MLERQEIEAFLTLTEELHFGRTAERLHLSTARVSQMIRKLERQVGVPLFNRTSRRVDLTAIGSQLEQDLRPGWAQIEAGMQRAIDTGKGLTGTLRVGFLGAAAGQLLAAAAEQFHRRHPDCAVEIREVQAGEALACLNDGEVEVLLARLPVPGPGIVTGPVLVTEARMLAVPTEHPLARQDSVCLEDLASVRLLQVDGAPASWRQANLPDHTPSGQPIASGPSAATFQEILTLVGAGQGAFLVGAHVMRYYTRPDVAYIPFRDAPPIQWALLWRDVAATARVRAFADTAHDLARAIT